MFVDIQVLILSQITIWKQNLEAHMFLKLLSLYEKSKLITIFYVDKQ